MILLLDWLLHRILSFHNVIQREGTYLRIVMLERKIFRGNVQFDYRGRSLCSGCCFAKTWCGRTFWKQQQPGIGKKGIAIKHPPWQANLLGQVQDQMDPSNVNYGSICGKGIREEGFKDRSPPEVANRRDQTVSIPSYALSNPRPSELLSSIFLVSSLKALSLFEFNPMSWCLGCQPIYWEAATYL